LSSSSSMLFSGEGMMCSRTREVQVLSAGRSPSLQLHNVSTWREKARKRLRPLRPHCAAAPPVHHGEQLSARLTTRWIEKKARKGGGGRGGKLSCLCLSTRTSPLIVGLVIFLDFSPVPVVCNRPEKDCRETLAGVLLGSFAVVGSQVREGKMKRKQLLTTSSSCP
jgi:hypothetical protein